LYSGGATAYAGIENRLKQQTMSTMREERGDRISISCLGSVSSERTQTASAYLGPRRSCEKINYCRAWLYVERNSSKKALTPCS
jgi:hypothetical protein